MDMLNDLFGAGGPENIFCQFLAGINPAQGDQLAGSQKRTGADAEMPQSQTQQQRDCQRVGRHFAADAAGRVALFSCLQCMFDQPDNGRVKVVIQIRNGNGLPPTYTVSGRWCRC